MGRSSRSSRPAAPARRPAPAPAPARAPPAPAARSAPAPAPQQSSGGGMLSGLGSTMAQGFAFGTGSAVAHSAVNSVMGSFSGSGKSTQEAPHATPSAAPSPAYSGACEADNQAFVKCMQQNSSNVAQCDFYYNALQQCQGSISSQEAQAEPASNPVYKGTCGTDTQKFVNCMEQNPSDVSQCDRYYNAFLKCQGQVF
mmetsp:Transcript_11698/g.11748  ORF Transcript_11698/g.11748 Transcript_11698/m.11748 type:complete len:198 (+) Transcript_11698:110-703(+)